MAYSPVDEDEFAAFSKRADEEAENAKKSASGGNFPQRDYEEVKWVGLDDKTAHIVRIVGRPPESMKPGSKVGPTDAHEIFISKIKDDKGNTMKLKLPIHCEDENHEHIMWRIINLAKSVQYRKGPDGKVLRGPDGKALKDYIYGDRPWFNKVAKGGFAEDDPQYQFARGWAGQQVCVMNVIDREDKWCAENKHTKLLSKKISISKKDGTTEFPEDGVPSFGFMSALSTIVGNYGSWEQYDVQLRRTGKMQNPIEVKPASIFKKNKLFPELDKLKIDYISENGSLTPEELEYERYNIEQLYSPTSYQKILSRLGNTIKAIDADLNKNFYNELQALAEKEKADWAALHPEGAGDNGATQTFVESTDSFDPYSMPILETPASNPAPASPNTTVATNAPVNNVAGLAPSKIALLKGWNDLDADEKSAIVDVSTNPDGTLASITYNDPNYTLVECPETFNDGSHGCRKSSPDWFKVCPCCGKHF